MLICSYAGINLLATTLPGPQYILYCFSYATTAPKHKTLPFLQECHNPNSKKLTEIWKHTSMYNNRKCKTYGINERRSYKSRTAYRHREVVYTKACVLTVCTGHAMRRHFNSVTARGLGRRTLKTITHHSQPHTERSVYQVRVLSPASLSYVSAAVTSTGTKMASMA